MSFKHAYLVCALLLSTNILADILQQFNHGTEKFKNRFDYSVDSGGVSVNSADGVLTSSYLAGGYRLNKDLIVQVTFSPESLARYHSIDLHFAPADGVRPLKVYNFATVGYTAGQGMAYDSNFVLLKKYQSGPHFGMGAFVGILDMLWLVMEAKYVFIANRQVFRLGVTLQP